jgi:hypothetical protein
MVLSLAALRDILFSGYRLHMRNIFENAAFTHIKYPESLGSRGAQHSCQKIKK